MGKPVDPVRRLARTRKVIGVTFALGCSRYAEIVDVGDAAESLMMSLELLGHHVRIAYDGVSAIAAAQANVSGVMPIDTVH